MSTTTRSGGGPIFSSTATTVAWVEIANPHVTAGMNAKSLVSGIGAVKIVGATAGY